MIKVAPKTGSRIILKADARLTGIVVPSVGDTSMFGMISIMLLDDDELLGSVISLSLKSFADDYALVPMEVDAGTVVIMSDMEGISGVPATWAAVTPAEETGGVRTAIYADSCRNMTLDVQFAVAGARAAGASTIIVADSHWHDSNLADADFDVPIVRGSMAALQAMQGADAAMLIGWHARAGSAKACLPHTYTERVARLSIDDREVGEAGMLARLAAGQGVPVVLVSGDQAACDEVKSDWNCRTVTSKQMRNGELVQREALQVRREILAGAIAAIGDISSAARPVCSPGRFDVAVRPGYEVVADADAICTERGYRIEKSTICDTYGAFQRFIERLPALRD